MGRCNTDRGKFLSLLLIYRRLFPAASVLGISDLLRIYNFDVLLNCVLFSEERSLKPTVFPRIPISVQKYRLSYGQMNAHPALAWTDVETAGFRFAVFEPFIVILWVVGQSYLLLYLRITLFFFSSTVNIRYSVWVFTIFPNKGVSFSKRAMYDRVRT